MKKISRSSPSLSKSEKDNSSVEEYEDPLVDVTEGYTLAGHPESSRPPLNASTPCLTESRPSSSVGTGFEWEEPWMANSDSCLVSSSSGASPLTGTSSQGVSPDGINSRVFSFHNSNNTEEKPEINDALSAEKDFMDYVMSFPVSSQNLQKSCYMDTFKKPTTDASPKVGLDHLDNLCKLMEQLSDLKEANVKLKRRVQYLEDLKTLHEIHREMFGASTICNSGVSDDELQIKSQKSGISPAREYSEDRSSEPSKEEEEEDNFHEFVTGLYRSKTTTHVDSRTDTKRDSVHRSRNDSKGKNRERSKSVGHAGHSKCKKRSSRWSKVKEVLGIEKTDPCVRNNSGTCVDNNGTFAALDAVEEHQHQMKRKNLNETSPRLRSTAVTQSNNDDHLRGVISAPPGCKKSPKTPWGRMKTIIQSRRDCRTQKSESSSSSSRGTHHGDKKVEGPDDSHHQSIPSCPTSEKNGNRRGTKPRKSSFTLQDVPKKHQTSDTEKISGNTNGLDKRASSSQGTRNAGDDNDAQLRIQQHMLRKAVADENTKRVTERTVSQNSDHSVKKTSSTKERPFQEQSISETPLRKQDTKTAISTKPEYSPLLPQEDTASGLIEALPVNASNTVTELLKELQQNLSDDFNRKLEEWQRFRGEKPLGLDVERKDSFGRFRKFSKPEKKVTPSEKPKPQPGLSKKDFNWLDKELPKVEREILRLSKEKQKFEKRAFRLRRLKEAMVESPTTKNEVLVRTSAGEFRFEGISNAFTKKLYEWETKKGVGPELSTIALLDESFNPIEPIVIQPKETRSIEELPIMTSPPEPNERLNYPKASSEPDLSTAQKESNGTLTTNFRSKSGDTLLSTCRKDSDTPEPEEVQIPEIEHKRSSVKSAEVGVFMDRDDNYCSLLEENMFLLDQLKTKEEICSRLQNELDRLDERSDKANKTHQDELENYKQKLWEIHMSRPRDLQGSLQLISELKTRIEELEKCSDKLKSDREKLEESFKYHSAQQSRLADDLMSRMMELQVAGTTSASVTRTGCKRRWKKLLNCDARSITKIHELSTKLLKQAREMEEALAERTRQVCHLRWELLHRDMSAVLLQAALHRVTCQGPQAALLPTWNMKRIKFKELKAWSIDTTTRRQSENSIAEDWLQDRLKQLSLAPYNEWTSIEFNPNDLMDTVHELKKETFCMSSCHSGQLSDSEEKKKTASCSAESELADSDRNYDTGSAFNSRSSSLSSGPGGGLRGSYSDTRLYERSRSLSIRRNSSSSMSCVSGFDASESSSVHDSDRIHQHLLSKGHLPWNRKKTNRWPSRENISSSCSSRSSGLEEEWDHERDGSEYDDRRLKYECLREADEESAEIADSLPNHDVGHCLIAPKPITMGLCTTVQNGPTYSLLKSLITHPSYIRASTTPVSSGHDSPEAEVPRSPNEGNQAESLSKSSSLLYASSPSTSAKVPAVPSQPSLPHTTVEPLENCSYMSHREQQLFMDIRNLAHSCDTDNAHEETPSSSWTNLEPQTSTTVDSYESPSFKVSSNISQIKYKGTRGFGRTSRIDFGTFQEEENASDSQRESQPWKFVPKTARND